MWKCPRNGCHALRSIKTGSIFANSKLPLWKAVRLLHLWANGNSATCVGKELDIDGKTLVDWFKLNREICSRYISDWRVPIGGEGVYVEIDVILCHNVSMSKKQWVFGGVHRGHAKDMFLVCVPNKASETLLSVITENVAPGSIIVSKQLTAFDEISELQGYNYTHLTVDPTNPIHHIETIESIWSCVNKMYKKIQRVQSKNSNEHFASYLDQFLFYTHYPLPSTFGNFLHWIGFYHPL